MTLNTLFCQCLLRKTLYKTKDLGENDCRMINNLFSKRLCNIARCFYYTELYFATFC